MTRARTMVAAAWTAVVLAICVACSPAAASPASPATASPSLATTATVTATNAAAATARTTAATATTATTTAATAATIATTTTARAALDSSAPGTSVAVPSTVPTSGSRPPSAISSGTRVVQDIQGDLVTVPANPQRVVTLSEPTLDGALALGVTPIGTTAGRGQTTVPNYLVGRASGIPLLGAIAQPNFEAIGAAKPDLILVDGTSITNNPPLIAELGEIAPTVFVGYAGGDWRTTFRNVANALNRVEEGERVLADYQQHVAEVAARLTAYDHQTFSIVRWQGGAASLILKELPSAMALTDLGLKRPPSQDRVGRGHSEPVSQENLPEIDADWMFFGTLGGSSVDNPQAGGGVDASAAKAALADAARTPGFTLLHAYQAGHIIPVDGSLWTSTGGPLLMNRIVDDVAAALVTP